jgi:hypothetical protein
MLQVILQFPYAGVDFRGDPEMVLPPGEVFDHRGMLCVLTYVFDFDILVHMFEVYTLIPFVVACLVHVQIWHLADVRWSYIGRQCSERGDLRMERGIHGTRLLGDP